MKNQKQDKSVKKLFDAWEKARINAEKARKSEQDAIAAIHKEVKGKPHKYKGKIIAAAVRRGTYFMKDIAPKPQATEL